MSRKDSGSNVKKKSDSLVWLVVFLVIAGGVYANYHFSEVNWALRSAAGIVVLAVAAGLALLTTAGQNAWGFMKASRVELRKVVWPTRQETVQTLLVVVAMVVAMAIILWAVDALFLWLVGFITGQRGI